MPPSSSAPVRSAQVSRTTAETKINCSLTLAGSGQREIATGIGFFDHMLQQLAFHARLDLQFSAIGDLHIDQHHTMEDSGYALGMALANALAERNGICRYGSAHVAMDEALARACIDLGGRNFLHFNVPFSQSKIGNCDTELFVEFFRAFVNAAAITLHIDIMHGSNNHHMIEAVFKATARALWQAYQLDNTASSNFLTASTKGAVKQTVRNG